MAVLLIAEVNGGELSVDSTAKALTAAKQMGDVTVLCVGSGCSSAAEAAASSTACPKCFARKMTPMAMTLLNRSPL